MGPWSVCHWDTDLRSSQFVKRWSICWRDSGRYDPCSWHQHGRWRLNGISDHTWGCCRVSSGPYKTRVSKLSPMNALAVLTQKFDPLTGLGAKSWKVSKMPNRFRRSHRVFIIYDFVSSYASVTWGKQSCSKIFSFHQNKLLYSPYWKYLSLRLWNVVFVSLFSSSKKIMCFNSLAPGRF